MHTSNGCWQLKLFVVHAKCEMDRKELLTNRLAHLHLNTSRFVHWPVMTDMVAHRKLRWNAFWNAIPWNWIGECREHAIGFSHIWPCMNACYKHFKHLFSRSSLINTFSREIIDQYASWNGYMRFCAECNTS